MEGSGVGFVVSVGFGLSFFLYLVTKIFEEWVKIIEQKMFVKSYRTFKTEE